MATVELRPPLPPGLPHQEVPFIVPIIAGCISPETLAAIAAALGEVLPPGDFCARGDGSLYFEQLSSAWMQCGRDEALDRSPLQ